MPLTILEVVGHICELDVLVHICALLVRLVYFLIVEVRGGEVAVLGVAQLFDIVACGHNDFARLGSFKLNYGTDAFGLDSYCFLVGTVFFVV